VRRIRAFAFAFAMIPGVRERTPLRAWIALAALVVLGAVIPIVLILEFVVRSCGC
jgi:hypothetical protein